MVKKYSRRNFSESQVSTKRRLYERTKQETFINMTGYVNWVGGGDSYGWVPFPKGSKYAGYDFVYSIGDNEVAGEGFIVENASSLSADFGIEDISGYISMIDYTRDAKEPWAKMCYFKISPTEYYVVLFGISSIVEGKKYGVSEGFYFGTDPEMWIESGPDLYMFSPQYHKNHSNKKWMDAENVPLWNIGLLADLSDVCDILGFSSKFDNPGKPDAVLNVRLPSGEKVSFTEEDCQEMAEDCNSRKEYLYKVRDYLKSL